MEKKLKLGTYDADLITEDEITVKAECREETEGVLVYRLVFDWEDEVSPKPVTVTLHTLCHDMYIQWDPVFKRSRFMPWIETKAFESRLAAWIPMVAYASKTGRSRLTVALSDVKTPIKLAGDVGWPSLDVSTKMTFFTSVIAPISHYEVDIRIDCRDIDFDKAVFEITRWYAELGYGKNHVPDAAYDAVYSTWYAYKRDVYSSQIIKECRAAKKLGMDVVIVDDGWQNVESISDYSYCGDWKAAHNRFPDMRAFVEEIHAIGMKVMLWFPISFIGMKADAHARFEGKYLYDRPERSCSVLDPRYKDVRDFLVNTFVDTVRDFNLDGLKLDYVDRFCRPTEPTPDMDFVSVEDATEALLTETHRALTQLNHDILIEFRQPYIGPVIGTYGNMLRVWDCPLDPMTNRITITDLRLTTNSAAVHSDMVVWSEGDSDESVATHLYSALFGVPQISVRLNEISAEHKTVLSAFMSFRNAHRDTLTRGGFKVYGIDSNYSRTKAFSDNESITLLSSAEAIRLDGYKDEYFINLTEQSEFFISGKRDGVKYEIVDCRGKRIGRVKKLLKNSVSITLPYASYVHFMR